MEFQNPEVAAKYKLIAEADINIICAAYHGPLSRLTLRGAEYLLKTKDPHIQEKKVTPAKKAGGNDK